MWEEGESIIKDMGRNVSKGQHAPSDKGDNYN